ncbi:MAG: LamG domain-containing protein [Lentisphaerae bacterium]|nr:LamG domain-containing protein [Lentisphaerota bacterium]
MDPDGVAGPALSFDGIDDYIDLGPGMNLGTNDATISIWYKIDAKPTSAAGVIGKSVYGPTKGRYSILWSANYITSMFHGNTEVSAKNGWQTSYYDGQWHQLTAVYARSSANSVYVDNELLASANISNSTTYNMKNTALWLIGAYGNSNGNAPQPNYYCKGSLVEARLMFQAVSEDWIWASHRNIAFNNSFNEYGTPVSNMSNGTIIELR